jgi:hypothetical protein
MIEVSGVTVPRAAITRLATNLHREGHIGTAHFLGHAIDHNLDHLALDRRAIEAILTSLRSEPIDELEPLRQRLLRG